MTLHVLGIRHHGPGSAASVERALAQLEPDCVLIEGPPELTEIVTLAADPNMVPPVAGFVYATDFPAYASFDPFASFSPEWVALQHALRVGATVRFMDIPSAHDLALRKEHHDAQRAALEASEMLSVKDLDGEDVVPDGSNDSEEQDTDHPSEGGAAVQSDSLALRARLDPIALLADLAGMGDPEQWWEDVIEHQLDNTDALASFDAVMSAMAELRAAAEDGDTKTTDNQSPGHPVLDVKREHIREAFMRQAIRRADSDGFQRIVVVCGAWHAPVLRKATFPSASVDAAAIKGLPKLKVSATWTPWTHRLLSRNLGYGAGVTAPGWYHHVYRNASSGSRRLITRWLVNAARALRAQQHDASSASVIEAVRLAETLASIRNRPLAGLNEVNDATKTVLCNGSEARFALVHEELLFDRVLGRVPDSTPQVPLAKDLAMAQKKLRLTVNALQEQVELDLRTPSGLAKSRLFHQLTVIGVPWAVPSNAAGRTTGTFKETWALEWEPELEVQLVEASRFGTTVEGAAASAALEQAEHATLPQLSLLLDQVLLGAVSAAVEPVLRRIGDAAAAAFDVSLLLDAIAPLARIARYGDVRQTDTDAVRRVLSGLIDRAAAGLPGAATQLDDVAATQLRDRIDMAHTAIGTVNEPEQRERWIDSLQRLRRASTTARDAVHGLIAGRVTRILFDAGHLDDDETQRSLSAVLSMGSDPTIAVSWVEGFFSGGGLVLLHDPTLLRLVDDWLGSVRQDTFDDLLPLLRRTFMSFATGERNQLTAAVKALSNPASQEITSTAIGLAELQGIAPTVLLLLGAQVPAIARTSTREPDEHAATVTT
jgi:hypothetical protein